MSHGSTIGSVVLCLVALTVPRSFAETVKPRLAIKTFENPATTGDSTIGNAVTDILFTELGRTGRFQLVERTAFDELAKEIDFGGSEWIKAGSGPAKGKALGAEFILLGKVSNFSYDEQAFQETIRTVNGPRVEARYRQTANVRVDFRVVSATTGVAVLTESGESRQNRIGALAELAIYRRILQSGVLSAESQGSLIGRATVAAVKNAIRKIGDLSGELRTYADAQSNEARAEAIAAVVGRVTGVVDGSTFVDIGSSQGLKPGDRLSVAREQVTKNQRGQVLFREQTVLGHLEVRAVDDVGSRAVFTAATAGAEPREGDRVQVLASPGSVTTGHAPSSGTVVGAGRGSDASVDVQRLVRQGDRYLEDRYFAQAVDAYQKGLAMQPGSPALLDKLATALLYNKQLLEAEDTINALFGVDGRVRVGIVHNHGMGYCVGELTVAVSGLSYAPKKGDDHFEAPAGRIVAIEPSHRGGMPTISLRATDERGKERRFDFLVPGYLRHRPGGMLSDIRTSFVGSAEELEDTEKVHRMLIRVAHERVLRRDAH